MQNGGGPDQVQAEALPEHQNFTPPQFHSIPNIFNNLSFYSHHQLPLVIDQAY